MVKDSFWIGESPYMKSCMAIAIFDLVGASAERTA